ncbi:MAG: hypothetical protein KJO05_03530 [Bacteroidia bacterium]|nr:hypothetical protein [Bacteroidia bacterium]NNF30301.1 hypothetical protein [Flavobacteriaceae bacterium]MBT8276377.1 hypothetical protein [Bacteroidia bacterium]NNJ80976.1 hypothetical protein [Flavobacteriaceae bacterium]NNK53554.1 hypothetical protein [Flavobacteriaceae bacterium]
MILGYTSLFGQATDLARIEYTFIPQSNSNNSINRFRGFVNFPIPLEWDGSYLVPGIEYRNVDLDIEDKVPFDTENLRKFQMFRLGIGYTFKMTEVWRVGMRAGVEIASNFEERTAVSSDLRFTGAAYLVKDRSRDSTGTKDRFIIGLQYSTNAGRPFPIPVINYFKKFHPDWSYTVGVPKMNLKHYITKKQTVQSFITIDGFFSNIQNDLPIPDGMGMPKIADNISMTTVMAGLGYEYFFSKYVLFYFYGAYTGYNEIRLRDTNRNSLYRINEENTFYIRSGIKLKL